MRPEPRRIACWTALALLTLGLMLPAADADEPPANGAEQAFARAELLRRASESVEPAVREAGNLPEIKRAIESRRKEYAQHAPAVLAEADRLLGQGEQDGLIQQGAILFRWILGTPEVSPVLWFHDPANIDNHVPETSERATPERRLEWSLRVAMTGPNDTVPITGGEARQADGSVRVFPSIADLRQLAPDDALFPLALTQANELQLWIARPWVVARESQVAARVQAFKADVPSTGLLSDRTVKAKRARAQRFRQRAEAYQGLRDRTVAAIDRMVAEEERLREDAGRLTVDLEEAQRLLKEATDEDDEEADPGSAGQEGDEPGDPPKDGLKPGDAPRDEPQPGDAPQDEPQPGDAPKDEDAQPKAEDDAAAAKAREASIAAARARLDRLQLMEIVSEQRMRLLYVAVRRAGLRLELYDEAIRQVKEEALAAEESQRKYEAELSRKRRETQMVQLSLEERKLRGRHEEAHAKAREEGRSDAALWAAHDQALESLIVLNETAREAVRLRRALEAQVRPKVPEQATVAAVRPDCAPPPGQAPSAVEPAQPQDPLRRFRDPSAAAMNATYVRDAAEVVDDPGWDARLTAQHYEAVDVRREDLLKALAAVRDTSKLEARHDQARATADEALRRLEAQARQAGDRTAASSWRWTARQDRTRLLQPTADAFKETLRGIAEERERALRDVAALSAFRERLLELEERSFRIRVDRTLDGERLGEAYGDVKNTVRDASRWVTFQGEDHAGSFLGRNWLLLVAGVGVVVFSIVLVRLGRHGLDGLTRHVASKVPALRDAVVTLRAEEAQARTKKARDEAAAKAAEEAVLEAVSKEQAAQAQKTGEGGYGGGGGS